MGLLDQFFAQPGLLNDMPPWMQALVQKPGDSQMPPWMQTPLGAPAIPGGQFPPMPQDPGALPPNAQQAGPGQLPPQMMPQQEPRRSMWTPQDSNPDSPPLGSPFGPAIGQSAQQPGGPVLGAPQAPQQQPQQQAPGMQAMAQANMPQQQQAPSFGGGLMDMLWGGADKRAGTTAALQKLGIDPVVAQAMARDKGLMSVAAPSLIGGGGTSDIKEFEYARKQGFKGTFQDWMTSKRSNNEVSLTPVYGTGPNGETVMLQPSKTGEAVRTKIPEGVTLSPGVEKVDLGTEWGIYDKKTGTMTARIPKDVAGAAQRKAEGTAQGNAAVTLPQVESSVNNAFKTIDSLRNHPGIDVGTGLSSKIDPRSFVPGQPGYDFHELNKQAQGQAFMAAREALKGAGQVTDFEGKKGEEAIANLNTAQSKEQYLRALDNVKEMIGASYENLKKKATGNFMPPATAPADADGWTTVNGVRIREKR